MSLCLCYLCFRFGSFEIFLGRDDFSGLQGPSAGRHDIRAQLLDYVIESFFPCIQQTHSHRKDRNMAFFREVSVKQSYTRSEQWEMIGKQISYFTGDDANGKASGPVAVCRFLPWRTKHRQHEYLGSHAGLWALWFHGQVGC